MEQPSKPSSAGLAEDRQPGDSDILPQPTTFESWRRAALYVAGVGLDDAERKAYEQEYEQRNRDKDAAQCEKWRDQLMKQSKYPSAQIHCKAPC